MSDWKDLALEPSGAREKRILECPRTKRHYLLKFPKYGSFECATEIFNGILATELGVRHVKYFPAMFGSRNGVICESFLDPTVKGQELWEMKELICRYSGTPNLDQKRGRDNDVLKEHNIDYIFLVLESEFDSPVLSSFFEMIGLDALIGHGDRHWSNYGVVVSFDSSTGKLSASFSPVYDTASGYLTEIKDPERLKAMHENDLNNTAWYRPSTIEGLCKITVPDNTKSNHFDLLERIVATENLSKYKTQVTKAFKAFDPGLPKRIIRKFMPGLDPLRAEIISKILKERHAIGSQILKI